MSLSWRLARRELRGGLRGFRIFLTCMALGVAAIAAVGTLRASIQGGLSDQGAVLLGGDAQIEFTYRFADASERAWMAAQADQMAQVVQFRSMVTRGDETALTQVKAVDGAYPLVGEVRLKSGSLAEALARKDGLPGAVMEEVLADRLGLAPGDRFRLGGQDFRLGDVLLREPDSAGAGLLLGPRTLVRTADLAGSGLLGPGAMFESQYRLKLPPQTDLAALQSRAEAQFKDKGMRWLDRRRAAPGVERFVDRMGSFLILVGLAALAVGGVGVQAAVRSHLDRKTATIATLKTLGAEGGLIFRIYLWQILVLTVLGIGIGLVLGAGLPLAFGDVIEAALPFPAAVALHPGPLLEAAFYGVMTALLFTLWPLSRSEVLRAAALYRAGRHQGWPRPRRLLALAVLALGLAAGAVWFSGAWRLTAGMFVGVLGAMAILLVAARAVRAAARRAARSRPVQGRPALRLALAAIAAPRSEAAPVILSLGLGLSVLAAVGQIDANLRQALDRDLPARAPSYFFIDIQPDQIDPFRARLQGNAAVSRVDSAPMLRGVLTQINGRPAREVAGDHWVVRGDRGLTYAAETPPQTRIVAGDWWPADYTGPAQVSFAAEEAKEMGLKLGDILVVNVLGRDIPATITSLREVDFSSAGMGFVMVFNAAALQGAPHSFIATVYARPEAEAGILRDLARQFPNITAIPVRDAIGRVTEALEAIGTATRWAASVTLATGLAVLIGAAAAGERARFYEAAVLKTLGASRGRILASFALRAALAGLAAGLVAIAAGGLAGWAVMRLVMEVPYHFEPVSAALVVGGGLLATLGAGLAFAIRPLAGRPAQALRAEE